MAEEQRLLIIASRRAHKGQVGYTRALYEQIFRIADQFIDVDVVERK